jgi:hypothetical protein
MQKQFCVFRYGCIACASRAEPKENQSLEVDERRNTSALRACFPVELVRRSEGSFWGTPLAPSEYYGVSVMSDDLSSLKDDMVAFILGHGMSRFQGYVTEDVHSVMWDPRDNPESWKDFVELAKKAGSAFLSMDEEVLQRDELDYLTARLQQASYPSDEDLEEARWLRSYVGKTGFIQLGWPHQGIMFLYEISTEWYERYQHLLDLVEDFGTLAIDDTDQDDEH